jgi:hypothetical protein
MKILAVFVTISAIIAGQDVPPGASPLLRRYSEGEKLVYRMKAVNEDWHYEIEADGVVKKGSDQTYFEEFGYSRFISDGQPVTLSPASANFRAQFSLDPNHTPGLPNLSQVDTRLIGPITDLFTFYTDVFVAVRTGALNQSGDHFYLKQGIPASWADSNYTLLGEDSMDLDFTLKDVNRARNTATLVVRHVPPEKPEVRIPADWMQKAIADTPNNWVQVQKKGEGKYLAAVGKEVFEDQIVLSLSDGKILSATMENPVQTVERVCTDSAATQCGEPRPRLIRRQIEISLER